MRHKKIVEMVKGLLLEPSKTFDVSKEGTLTEALKYFFILVLISSVLQTLIRVLFGDLIGSMIGKFGMISISPIPAQPIMSAVMYPVYATLSILLFGGIIHLGVFIVGGKKGLNQTTRVCIYGSTPSLLLGWIPMIKLLGWIPVINIIALIWSLILYIIGIRKLQEISIERAFVGVLMPIIILILVYWKLWSVFHVIT
jgi:hypothetical protein